MRIFKQLILVVLLFNLTFACRREKSDISIEDIKKRLSNINEDTTFVDENGRKWEVNVGDRNKIEDVSNSINGPVKYAFFMNNGEHVYDQYGNIAKKIYKEVYKNDSYEISISNDSLKVGQVFRGTIWSKFDRYLIEVVEPREEIANNKTNEENVFEFTCSVKGIYNFKGKVKSDSSSFLFDYKFIVN